MLKKGHGCVGVLFDSLNVTYKSWLARRFGHFQYMGMWGNGEKTGLILGGKNGKKG